MRSLTSPETGEDRRGAGGLSSPPRDGSKDPSARTTTMSVGSYRSQAQVVIAVDDTDSADEGGTGGLAREVARRLAGRFPVWGVTRHQFILLPEIPYTARNSGNVVHLLRRPPDLNELRDGVAAWVRQMASPGSDPGLCIAPVDALLGCELGRAAQERFVAKDEVRAAARNVGATLDHVCDTDDGIVGAFAGACLAASGDDGRFVQLGTMRSLTGQVTVEDVLAAGGDEVQSVEGDILQDGTIIAERLRPALRGGRCVLYCTRRGDGLWLPVKGAPGDEDHEARIHAPR